MKISSSTSDDEGDPQGPHQHITSTGLLKVDDLLANVDRLIKGADEIKFLEDPVSPKLNDEEILQKTFGLIIFMILHLKETITEIFK